MTPTPEVTGRRRWLALAVLGLASFLDGLDVNIVTVALPSIQRDLDGGYATAQWTMAGYALTFAVFLVTGGRLGDIFGVKRVFMTGVALFTASSVLAGVAFSPTMLVAGRCVQGLAAALMLPQVMAVIVRIFDRRERALASGVVGGMLSVGTIGGPLVGGLLTDLDVLGLGWRAVFFVNVPIGLVTLVLGARALPSFRGEARPRLDVPSVLLLTAASLALLFPLMQGREYGWPAWTLGMMAASLPLLGLFVVHQRRRHRRDGSALVPPTLFRRRSFSVGLAVALLSFTGTTSFSFVLTYHLQVGLGWTAGYTALAIAAWPLGIVATFQVSLRLASGRERLFVAAGSLVMALTVVAAIRLLGSEGAALTLWHVLPVGFLMGVGMGLSAPVLAAFVLQELPPQDAGAGSGVVNATTQFGSAAGVAGVGALLFALVGEAAAAAPEARAAGFASAAATTLWCNVVAFLVTAGLTALMRDRAAPAAAGDGGGDGGENTETVAGPAAVRKELAAVDPA